MGAGRGQAPPAHTVTGWWHPCVGGVPGSPAQVPGDSAGGNRERLASGGKVSAGRLWPQWRADLAGGRTGSGQRSRQSRSSCLCPGTHRPILPEGKPELWCWEGGWKPVCPRPYPGRGATMSTAAGGIPRAHPGHLGRPSLVVVTGGTRCPQAGWGSQRCRGAGGGAFGWHGVHRGEMGLELASSISPASSRSGVPLQWGSSEKGGWGRFP